MRNSCSSDSHYNRNVRDVSKVEFVSNYITQNSSAVKERSLYFAAYCLSHSHHTNAHLSLLISTVYVTATRSGDFLSLFRVHFYSTNQLAKT